jgi:hypothetical protein
MKHIKNIKYITFYKILLILLILIIICIIKNKNIELFENNLNTAKNRICFSHKINNNELKCYTDLIIIVNKILTIHNIDWIPIGGSLLAIYRHNNLFIPWDDDYDIVFDETKIEYALQILKKELPKYGANLVYFRKWKQKGDILKIFFNSNHINYKNTIVNHGKFTWPFVDIFINTDKNDNNCLANYNLTKQEYPLEKRIVNGIIVKVPTKGKRSYKHFKHANLLTICKEDSYNHKHEKHIKCIGNNETTCNKL